MLPNLDCVHFTQHTAMDRFSKIQMLQECIRLVAAILDAAGIDLLIARLRMFKETSEEIASAVTAMLVCFQNMGDVDPRVLTALAQHSLLVPWLVDRIYVVKNRKFDENKGLAAELLANLAQVMRARSSNTKCRCHLNFIPFM